MDRRSFTPYLWLALLAFASMCFLAACSSDPTTVAAGGDDDATDLTPTSLPLEDVAPDDKSSTTSTTTTTEPTPTTKLPASTAPPTTSTTTTPVAPTTTLAPIDLDLVIEPIGEVFPDGNQLVWMHEDVDQECRTGTLAVQRIADGAILHTYDDLGEIGYPRFEGGLRAQFALIEYCEEWVNAIHFINGQVPPPNGIPEIETVTPPDSIFFLTDFVFLGRTGWLSAEATFADIAGPGWNELVVFEPFDGTTKVLADVWGERVTNAEMGADYVVPHGWELVADTTIDVVSMVDTESGSYLSIVEQPPGYEVLAEGDELINTYDSTVRIWEDLGDGRARISDRVEVTEVIFGSDFGARTVILVDTGERLMEIEYFLDHGTGAVGIDTPWITAELVRFFR